MPRVIITDKLRSYGAAKREILPGVEHRQHKRLNNRVENSHQQVDNTGLFIPVFRLAERSESVVEWIREPGSEPMVGGDAFITL